MSSPVLPELSLAPLRAIVEAGLVHQAQRQTVSITRLPNGEEVSTTDWADPVDALLSQAGDRLQQQAASLGVVAQWSLKLLLTEPVIPGDLWRVTGDTDGTEWTRDVKITADLGLVGRLARKTTAVDVALNQ